MKLCYPGDRMEHWQLETAKNIATNGRLFCVMIFIVALSAFFGGFGAHFMRIALLCAAPVGLSVIIDQMPHGRAYVLLSLGNVALAAMLAVILFLSIG